MENQGRTITLVGTNLVFANYGKAGTKFCLPVGHQEQCKGTTIKVLGTGHLMYTLGTDGTPSFEAHVPVGATKEKFWCNDCASSTRRCSKGHNENIGD